VALRITTASGETVHPHIPALARLRQAVFREWPYLYEGTEAYEADYLALYARSTHAALVIAWDGEEPVGFATCMPMLDETPNVVEPFRAAGLDIAEWFYFGESVLLRPYRGQGAGVRFFEGREAHAQSCGARRAAFCAVQRQAGHPARPAGATTLEGFWRNRGFALRPGLTCTMRWRGLGDDGDSGHLMQFWTKAL
jgi:GNAT superfamily N-acetyltransferase